MVFIFNYLYLFILFIFIYLLIFKTFVIHFFFGTTLLFIFIVCVLTFLSYVLFNNIFIKFFNITKKYKNDFQIYFYIDKNIIKIVILIIFLSFLILIYFLFYFFEAISILHILENYKIVKIIYELKLFQLNLLINYNLSKIFIQGINPYLNIFLIKLIINCFYKFPLFFFKIFFLLLYFFFFEGLIKLMVFIKNKKLIKLFNYFNIMLYFQKIKNLIITINKFYIKVIYGFYSNLKYKNNIYIKILNEEISKQIPLTFINQVYGQFHILNQFFFFYNYLDKIIIEKLKIKRENTISLKKSFKLDEYVFFKPLNNIILEFFSNNDKLFLKNNLICCEKNLFNDLILNNFDFLKNQSYLKYNKYDNLNEKKLFHEIIFFHLNYLELFFKNKFHNILKYKGIIKLNGFIEMFYFEEFFKNKIYSNFLIDQPFLLNENFYKIHKFLFKLSFIIKIFMIITLILLYLIFLILNFIFLTIV